jgi:elongation factor P
MIKRQDEEIQVLEANKVRKGNSVFYENTIYWVMDTLFNQPGKGAAYIHLTLKNITTGGQKIVKFHSADKVELAILLETPCQYLYDRMGPTPEDSAVVFLDLGSLDEIEVPLTLVHKKLRGFLDGCITHLELLLFGQEAVAVTFPQKIAMRIEECSPSMQGETAKASFKPAVLSNKAQVMVPSHINAQDMIYVKIDPIEGKVEFLEKEKTWSAS